MEESARLKRLARYPSDASILAHSATHFEIVTAAQLYVNLQKFMSFIMLLGPQETHSVLPWCTVYTSTPDSQDPAQHVLHAMVFHAYCRISHCDL